MIPKLNILLSGIVGSTAYGLNHAGSDVDHKGIYAAPTRQLLGLRQPPDVIETKNPDTVLYELGKFIRLALGCNPNVIELLWIPFGLQEATTLIGRELVAMRALFLSAKRVRDAYFGYATQQIAEIQKRDPRPKDRAAKDSKNARHIYRLLHQGLELYTTGRLVLRLPDDVACRCFAFGRDVADGDITKAKDLLAAFEAKFDQARTPLPAQPSVTQIDRWLRETRIKLMSWHGMDIIREPSGSAQV